MRHGTLRDWAEVNFLFDRRITPADKRHRQRAGAAEVGDDEVDGVGALGGIKLRDGRGVEPPDVEPPPQPEKTT
jgi:hypothetical protein